MDSILAMLLQNSVLTLLLNDVDSVLPMRISRGKV